MPGMTGDGRGGRPGRSRRKYDTPRWQDKGPLIPGAGKEFVRKATERTSGRTGVLKHADGGLQRKRRFYDEAVNMHQMNGTPGILPVWDIDDAHRNEPGWYAMPPAQLLGDALGKHATLRDVVSGIAFLADVLAKLAEQGTFHRDIKPSNLFWWDEGPVLADFGIAAWGPGWSSQALPTRPLDKLGPANFIAPEMRSNRPADRGRRADVYSLAKTLFVLTLPHQGLYPPDGTHHADRHEFSLWETGGGTYALAALRQVLEAATEFSPGDRLSMADFRDELQAWLDRYPREPFRPRGDPPRFRMGLEAGLGLMERGRRDREETRLMMLPCIAKIADALTGDPQAWVERREGNGGEMLGSYGWEPTTDEDDFMPENGTVWMATQSSGGRRIALEAVLDTKLCFCAEAQSGGPPWSLERQWGPTEWSRPRMPRTARQVEQLTDRVIAGLASRPLP
jgi:Protein kinase domain